MNSLEEVDDRQKGSRLRIIDAAWQAAAKRGFSHLSLGDVCVESGLGEESVREHFETKQDLLMGLLNDDSAQLEVILYRLETAALSGAERLSRFVEAALEVGANPDRAAARRDLWSIVLSRPDLREWAAERIRGRRTILRNWIERVIGDEFRPVPANALASVLLALNDGLILHSSLDPTSFRWENVGITVDTILGGLRKDTLSTRTSTVEIVAAPL